MSIEFRCHQCHHLQTVDSSKIGQQVYCRVCYLKLTVPAESTVKAIDESQLYTADAEPLDVREMHDRHALISLCCDLCKTNIGVRKEQVGEEITCPECGSKITVPKAIAEKAAARLKDKLDKVMLGLGTMSQKETYSLRDGTSVPTDDWSKRFRVICQLCGTPLFATEEQVGTFVTCPDCETKTKVPPPPKKIDTTPVQPMTFEGDAVFGFATPPPPNATNTPFSVPPPPKEKLVPVVCHLCQTRMYAKESQIGQFKTCPDCGRQTEIKAVPKHEMTTADAVGTGAYEVDVNESPAPRPTFRTLTDYRYVDGSLDKQLYGDRYSDENSAKSKRKSKTTDSQKDEFHLDPSMSAYYIDAETLRERRERRNQKNPVSRRSLDRPKLPTRPLTERFFVPFADSGVWLRLTLFTLVGLVGALLLFSLDGILDDFGTIFTSPLTLILYVVAFSYLASFSLQLFGLTSSGSDDGTFDGEVSLFDYFINGLWFLAYVVVTATPGFFIADAWCVPSDSVSSPEMTYLIIYVAMRISHWILFPICFLSSMEADSLFIPLAKNTLFSFWRQPFAWLRFYSLTGVLFVLSDVCIFVLLNTWLASIALMFYVFVTFFFLLFAVQSMFFFRLLGRLAWLLEETERQKREFADEED